MEGVSEMTHINLGHYWKCNTCGKVENSEEEHMPDGWWAHGHNPYEAEMHYCSTKCLFVTMTPEEIKHFENTPAMA